MPTSARAQKCQPGPDPKHAGCTAGPITPGAITIGPAAAARFESHDITFTIAASTDIDHCCAADGTVSDEAETVFTVTWTVQRYNEQTQAWDDVAALGAGNSVTWTSTNALPAPYRHRIRARVDDTPATGTATGDDPAVDAFQEFQLIAPEITNIHQTAAGPHPAGVLHFEYDWDSTCGAGAAHKAHLGHCTMRENVRYDVTDNPHHLGHPDGMGGFANIFTSQWTNPTQLGVAGTGTAQDNHSVPTLSMVRKRSYCRADQEYQGGYAYPTRPAPNATIPAPWPDWKTQMTPIIQRWVEPMGMGWQYRATKSGETATVAI